MKDNDLSRYGTDRVLEPKNVLTTTAWRIDNSRKIAANEARISLKKILIESTSFKQICIESNNDIERIKSRIVDIIEKRGKLHNPVTNTGGVLYGVVEEIGPAFENETELEVGEEIICNVSLASVPIYISRITSVDMAYTQIDVEGYGILFEDFPVIKTPDDLPIDLLLVAMNESGTLLTVNENAKDKKAILLLGNQLAINIIFGYAARKAAPDAEIICILDKTTGRDISGDGVDILINKIFDEVHYEEIIHPLELLKYLDLQDKFDMTVNCADIPGAETINILATKPTGTLIYANLINNYATSLYVTEATAKQLDIRGADGFLRDYGDFDIELIRDIAPYFKDAKTTMHKVKDDIDSPLGKSQRGMEQPGYRKSIAEDFICESRAMMTVLNEILSVAKYDCNVLITGETGVGKEKVANVIHKNSTRNMQNYVKVNCAAISPNLMESEFFGYEKGAFTGASTGGKRGYFEVASNGVIFLDEVSELPFDLQAKLLRVIQDGEFFRVGGTEPVKTNVRIISATNKNLEDMVTRNEFRRDLYYRLNVFPIHVPSLKERKGEIPALINHFLKGYNEKFGLSKSISKDSIDYLQERSWPGNIRELENMVQRLLIASESDKITVLDVMRELHTDLFATSEGGSEEGDESPISLDKMIESFENRVISQAYDKYGSTRKAAKAIGISQTQFVRKRKRLLQEKS